MIVQFSIYPMDSTHIARDVRKVVDMLRDVGLEPQVGPIGTCVEGEWATVMPAIQECHKMMAAAHERVITTIIIDDHGLAEHTIRGAVKAVEPQLNAPHATLLDDEFPTTEQ
jgi:uncharacterized protein (TIGR00106 family)